MVRELQHPRPVIATHSGHELRERPRIRLESPSHLTAVSVILNALREDPDDPLRPVMPGEHRVVAHHQPTDESNLWHDNPCNLEKTCIGFPKSNRETTRPSHRAILLGFVMSYTM
jgi:hypothetical protein